MFLQTPEYSIPIASLTNHTIGLVQISISFLSTSLFLYLSHILLIQVKRQIKIVYFYTICSQEILKKKNNIEHLEYSMVSGMENTVNVENVSSFFSDQIIRN